MALRHITLTHPQHHCPDSGQQPEHGRPKEAFDYVKRVMGKYQPPEKYL
jgi:hypothetical protein